ncbi:MAG: DNA polymerase I [Candidatus Pacebacteria bacterium]|nr:DNA polymerase I [Candidatus Paceibacterota bacterium]
MRTEKKFILIDGNAIMHRAFHAMPPLTTKNGEVVSVAYGFASVLLRVVKDIKPAYIACAFDVAGGTFRDDIFDKYKAGRKKPDQEFYDQIDKVKEVVRAMNIPIYEKAGFEADDVIGTIAREIKNQDKGVEVFIVTGDMDALQLVDERIRVYALKKGISDTVIYDEGKVFERYGLSPLQIIDFKALRGDASDNIPGVKGIGEKGAINILQEFGSVKNLYEKILSEEYGSLSPKIVEKLIAEKDAALMSKELATIKCDVAVGFHLEDCIWGDYNKEALLEVFRKYEFFSLISRLNEAEKENGMAGNNMAGGKDAAIAPGINFKKYSVVCHIVETEKDLDGLMIKLKNSDMVAIRTIEEKHLIAQRNLSGLVFALDVKEIFFIPVAIKKSGEQSLFGEQREENDFLSKLKFFLESDRLKKIGFDLKRDAEALAVYDIRLGGIEFDAMLAAYLLDPGKRDYGEEKILFDNLGVEGTCEVIVKNGAEIDCRWAMLVYLFALKEKTEKELGEAGMERLFTKIEMPLVSILCRIEMNGIKIDNALLRALDGKIKKDIEKLEKDIHSLSGNESFNINSSKQLAQVLFEEMKIPVADIKKGKTGYSVAASELDKLRDEYEIADHISNYRELTKLKNTYIDALPKLVNPSTGRLHTTFHQNVTATGRLSSSDPNLQNIPIRTDIGREIRAAFVAEEGRVLLSADYSQIELRIIATIADDKKMQDIFRKGLDIHSATAAEVNGVSLDEVTSQMRRAAKALNFGVIYGMSVFGFAKSAGISRDEAKKFIDSYMQEFAAVAKYIENSKIEATEKGYAETLWGRRRYLPELRTSNSFLRASAERMAINMPIQGTAADLMKINMIKIDEWEKSYNAKNTDATWTLLQVHDELLFSIKQEFLEEVQKEIKHIMENGHIKFDGKDINFSVPIEVSLKSGKNWGEMD